MRTEFVICFEMLAVIIKGIMLILKKEKDEEIIEAYLKYADRTIALAKNHKK